MNKAKIIEKFVNAVIDYRTARNNLPNNMSSPWAEEAEEKYLEALNELENAFKTKPNSSFRE